MYPTSFIQYGFTPNLLLPLFVNVFIGAEILSKPSIWNMFNLSLAFMFGFLGLLSPLLTYSYHAVITEWRAGPNKTADIEHPLDWTSDKNGTA